VTKDQRRLNALVRRHRKGTGGTLGAARNREAIPAQRARIVGTTPRPALPTT
jgi:hypothetical protein